MATSAARALGPAAKELAAAADLRVDEAEEHGAGERGDEDEEEHGLEDEDE